MRLECGLLVIGGGPGGLAPLLSAHRRGRLDDLLSAGVVVVERSQQLGDGDIGRYAISSDSTGRTFVDCLEGPHPTPLTALRSHELALAVGSAGEGSVPLELVGRFLRLVGDTLRDMIVASPGCHVLTGHQALSVRADGDGWVTELGDALGQRSRLRSRFVVSATGAHQPRSRLAREYVAGVNVVERWGEKLLQTGDVLTPSGLDLVSRRLAGLPDPRVAVIGGSTSAVATAHALLHRVPALRFGEGAVTVLHRRPLRVFYPSAADAIADGYLEFSETDICPLSKRVFRLAGFRLESRDLVMRARGLGGRSPEPRLALRSLDRDDEGAREILERADLVIAGFGYRPRAVPVFDADGLPIELLAESDARAPLVDGLCRILDAKGLPLSGLFAIGLAAGFVPHGALGGEPSFIGQANGLWLWQNDVGWMIADAVLDGLEETGSDGRRHGASALVAAPA